jgi:hypothetical protein
MRLYYAPALSARSTFSFLYIYPLITASTYQEAESDYFQVLLASFLFFFGSSGGFLLTPSLKKDMYGKQTSCFVVNELEDSIFD